MSYYSQLQLSWDDSDFPQGNLTVEMLGEIASEFANTNNWSQEIVSDLKGACESEQLGDLGFNNAYSHGINELLEFVSKKFPEVTFYAKGSGEEFLDIWIRVYRGGFATMQFGPFVSEDEAMFPQGNVASMDAEHRDAFDNGPKKPSPKPWWKKIFRPY
jgi:hypothetical protein